MLRHVRNTFLQILRSCCGAKPRRGMAGKVCRDGKKKTGNQLCEPGAPRREGGATLLKFGCGVVSIKIAGINISRGEKRFTRFPRKEMILPCRAVPFGYKSPGPFYHSYVN